MSVRVVYLWESMKRIGGITTFLHHAINELPRFGVDAYVVELREPPTGGTPFDGWGRERVAARFPRLWQTPYGYRRNVVKSISRLHPHVLVTNNQCGWEFLASFRRHLPIIDIMHVDSPDALPWELLRQHEPDLHGIVAVSRFIEARLKKTARDQSKIAYIPYGVVGNANPRSDRIVDKPSILFVGRLIRQHKRVQDLIPFANALSAQIGRFSLIVVGDGPERSFLEKALRECNCEVSFTGAISPAEVTMWYKRAHFLFQPSEFEGLSIALLEAMSYGVVPIASIIESGVQQVVTHGDNGFLFPVGMPEQCAQDIAYGLTNWANLSENAWNAVRQHYSLEQMCYAHARLYQSIATSPLKNAPHYVDQGYQGWRGWIARRTIPIPVYRSLCGPVI